MRLIDADELKEQMLDTPEHERDIVDLILEALVAMVDEQPTIEERKMGKWTRVVDRHGINGESVWKCSSCLEMTICKGNFCPNCGARMKL